MHRRNVRKIEGIIGIIITNWYYLPDLGNKELTKKNRKNVKNILSKELLEKGEINL